MLHGFHESPLVFRLNDGLFLCCYLIQAPFKFASFGLNLAAANRTSEQLTEWFGRLMRHTSDALCKLLCIVRPGNELTVNLRGVSHFQEPTARPPSLPPPLPCHYCSVYDAANFAVSRFRGFLDVISAHTRPPLSIVGLARLKSTSLHCLVNFGQLVLDSLTHSLDYAVGHLSVKQANSHVPVVHWQRRAVFAPSNHQTALNASASMLLPTVVALVLERATGQSAPQPGRLCWHSGNHTGRGVTTPEKRDATLPSIIWHQVRTCERRPTLRPP
ncbi:unnamed protein product [Mesocestoides corti]|uniref:Uncharacterized protein n=1 Tax=Mesocestoides corti TaxID=53468 RepID=A0A0R3U466_MESCO|nr:unnamed protein product [Mesocestoides corti]